jgi:hypothetical protein
MNETTKRDYSAIPATACILAVGEFELGDNGENAKSAPVRLVARSGKAIQHWFWGSVVHDLAGMSLHKPRIPIDYIHDMNQVIGYLNKFDKTSGDLVTSGALVPFKDSDRATEIIHKMKAGVPYEASINFGGDGIKFEEIAEGQTCEVNGARFEGPGVVIREWPLRGVAICPYGADMNTESRSLSASDKTYSAAVFAAPGTTKKETDMSQATVDIVAQAEKPKAEVTSLTDKPVEVKPVEAAPVVPAVETKPTEGKPAEAAAPVVLAADTAMKPESRDEELKRIATEFGPEILAKIVSEGGNYDAALKLAYSQKKEKCAALEGQVAELTATKTGKPAEVTAVKESKKSLFNTGK